MSASDQHDATDQQGNAQQARNVNLPLRHAEPTELIESQSGNHLPGDQ